jgi:hypothetical protein
LVHDVRQLADLLERLNSDLNEQAEFDVPDHTPDSDDVRKETA